MNFRTLLLALVTAGLLLKPEVQALTPAGLGNEVQTTLDSGPGSLRDTIANALPDSTITFNPSLAGQAIVLTSGELLIDKNLTINGLGARVLAVERSTEAGTPEFRIFRVAAGTSASISGLTIAYGRPSPPLFDAMRGGGIYNQGDLVLEGVAVSHNFATVSGGGLCNITGGTVTVRNSTISYNESGEGGGISNMAIGGTVACTIDNSTISGNHASQDNGGLGGGFFGQASSGGTAKQSISNSTVSHNQADSGGGGIYIRQSLGTGGTAITTFRNSIVAKNSPPDVDLSNASVDGSFNLVEQPDFLFASGENNIIGQDPLLGPLANNGGPTDTHALLNGSPAIDAASCSEAATDQRGIARPQGIACDIGAFERQPIENTKPQVECNKEPNVYDCMPAAGALLTEEVVVIDPDLGQTLTVTFTVGDLVLTKEVTTPVNDKVTFDAVPLLPGEHLLTIVVSDGYSEATCESSVTINADRPPVIQSPAGGSAPSHGGLVLPPVTVTATSSAGAVVTYPAITVTDECTPIEDIKVTYSQASGTLFSVGSTKVTCTAIDAAGNQAVASFVVTVTYSAPEVAQPINPDGSSVFKAGSTVPVKFKLTGGSAGITDLKVRLSYVKVDDLSSGDVNEAVATSAASSGNIFRYDGGQYIYNWSTKGLSPGRYELQIDLGDGITHIIKLALKK